MLTDQYMGGYIHIYITGQDTLYPYNNSESKAMVKLL